MKKLHTCPNLPQSDVYESILCGFIVFTQNSWSPLEHVISSAKVTQTIMIADGF